MEYRKNLKVKKAKTSAPLAGLIALNKDAYRLKILDLNHLLLGKATKLSQDKPTVVQLVSVLNDAHNQ